MKITSFLMKRLSWIGLITLIQLLSSSALAESHQDALEQNQQDWLKQVRSSIVNVNSFSKTGKLLNSGSGFVISKDGKIATHLSGLREASVLKIEFEDGRTYSVDSVYAHDSVVNLAILKVKGHGYRPLTFGDADFINENDEAIAMGYSMGLESNIEKGYFREREEVDGIEKFIVDFDIDKKNIGGPIFNEEGQVVGILGKSIDKKSTYAVQVNDLNTLMVTPNPMAMKAWLKKGRLDKKYWRPIFGAHWIEKQGEIKVEDEGDGFGGRALCLWQRPKPKGAIEFSVKVKLSDESGAAGLVFHSDGSEKHYAFYPSNGQMRLTYFGGPNVYSWEIINEVSSPHYQRGEWNHLKVTIQNELIKCYVNDKMVIQSDHKKRLEGRVGLAKFRDTVAQFKNFKVAKYVSKEFSQQDKMDELNNLVDQLPNFSDIVQDDISEFTKQEDLSRLVLIEKQKRLEEELVQTKKLMQEIHLRNVCREMGEVLDNNEEDIDLWKLSLLISKLDDRNLDVDYYSNKLDQMGMELKRGTETYTQLELKEKLDRFLFEEQGYHGARFDYYQKQNSYVHRVLEDRKGIPLSLSVLYMELGKRMGLHLEGVGLPGHFVVKMGNYDETPVYIDVFNGGDILERPDLEDIVLKHTKAALKDEYLFSMSKKNMAKRMLSNLLVIAENNSDRDAMLRYLATEVSIIPELINERVMLSVIYYEAGRQMAAEEQLRFLLNGNIRLEDVRKIEDMLVYMMNHPKS